MPTTTIKSSAKDLTSPYRNRWAILAHYLWFVLDTPFRWLFGRDVFISYSRADGLEYAEYLAMHVVEKRLTRYLDIYETIPGGSLPKRLRRALNRASLLVVVGTDGAATSVHVLQEVEAFSLRKRPILPINVNGALSGSLLQPYLKGAVEVSEKKEAVQVAEPSQRVLNRLRITCATLRQENRLRLASGGAALLIVISIVGAIVSLIVMSKAQSKAELAQEQANQARQETVTTLLEKQNANFEKLNANLEKQSANKSANIAKKAAAESERSAEKANHRRADAEKRADSAEDRKVEADKLKQNSIAERLASEADRNADQNPQLSLLLAVEALYATEKVGESRVFPAESVLRRQLAVLGGEVLQPLPAEAPPKVEPTPDDNMDQYRDKPPPFDPDDETPWFIANGLFKEGGNIIVEPKKIARFSSDNHWFLSFKNKDLQLWDLTAPLPGRKATVELMLKSEVAPVDLSADGKWLMAIEDGKLLLWNLQQTAPQAESIVILHKKTNLPYAPDEAMFSPDNKYLVIGDAPEAPSFYDLQTKRFTTGETSSATVTETEDPSPFRLAPPYRPLAFFSKDKRWLLYSDEASTSWIYDLKGSQPTKAILGLPQSAFLAFSDDSLWLVTKTLAGKAQIRNLTKPALPAITVKLSDRSEGYLPDWNYLTDNSTRTNIIISPNGSRLLDTTGIETVLWNFDKPEAPASAPLIDGVYPVMEEEELVWFFSPDARWLIGKFGGLVDLNAPKQKEDEQTPYDPAAGSAHQIKLSPDGRWLLFLNDEGQIYLRDLKPKDSSQHPDAELKLSPGKRYVNFSPDSRLVVVTDNNTVRITTVEDFGQSAWNYRSLVLRGHEGAINRCVFSQDGRWLVSIGEDNHPRLWNLEHQSIAAQPMLLGYRNKTKNELSADGTWLVSCDLPLPCVLRNLKTQQLGDPPLAVTNSLDPGALVFSPNSNLLFTTDKDGHGIIWDLTNRQKPQSVSLPGSAYEAIFTPGNRRLITRLADGMMRIWDLPLNQRQPAYFDLAQPFRRDWKFTKDDTWMFSLQFDLWNLSLRDRARLNKLPNDSLLAYSDNGEWMVTHTFGKKNCITLWKLDPENNAPSQIKSGEPRKDYSPFGWEATFSPNNRWLLTNDGQTPLLWDLKSTETAASPTNLNVTTDEASKTAMSPDGRWLAVSPSSGSNGSYILDLANGVEKHKLLTPNGQWTNLGKPTFSPDSRFLVTHNELFDLKADDFTGHQISRAERFEDIGDMAFSPDSRWLLEVSDTSAALRDLTGDLDTGLANQAPITDFQSHSFRFSAGSHWLQAVDKETGEQRIWNLMIKKTVSNSFLLPKSAVPISEDYFLDDSQSIWFMKLEDLQQLALRVAGRPLTTKERSRYLITEKRQ